MINWELAVDANGRRTFSPTEWPAGAIEQMEPEVFHELFKLRRECGQAITPSPLLGAHVRAAASSSRHSTHGGTRKSDATDFFLRDWKALWPTYLHALRLGFGGIGVYLDKQMGGVNRPMMHVDMRPERVLWVTTKQGEYVTYNRDPNRYLQILSTAGR